MGVNMSASQMSDKEEIIHNILSAMRRSTNAWKDVAKELLRAKTKFGGSSDTYREICKTCRFSSSTASKLCTIAEDKRIAENDDVFGAVDSWTTLYLVTQIEGEKDFKDFVKKVKRDLDDKPITGSYVTKFTKRNEPKQPTDPFRILFDVSVDSDAMREGKFGSTEYTELQEKLKEIETMSKGAISITPKPAFTSYEARFFDDTNRAKNRILSAKLTDALDAWDKTHKAKDLILGRYEKRSDVRADFSGNEIEILEEFGVDVDEVTLNIDAENEVRKAHIESIKKRKAKEAELLKKNKK